MLPEWLSHPAVTITLGGLLAAGGGALAQWLGNSSRRREQIRQTALQLALRDWEHKDDLWRTSTQILADVIERGEGEFPEWEHQYEENLEEVSRQIKEVEALMQTPYLTSELSEGLQRNADKLNSIRETIEKGQSRLFEERFGWIEDGIQTLRDQMFSAVPAPLYVAQLASLLEEYLSGHGDKETRDEIVERIGVFQRAAEKEES